MASRGRPETGSYKIAGAVPGPSQRALGRLWAVTGQPTRTIVDQ
jgi:hypothetical protein